MIGYLSGLSLEWYSSRLWDFKAARRAVRHSSSLPPKDNRVTSPTMGIHLHQSVAVSFTGALAFGLYFATLLACLRWLLFASEGWRIKPSIRWGTVVITLLIFASNVVYLSMSLHGTMLTAQHAAMSTPGMQFYGPSWISIVSVSLGVMTRVKLNIDNKFFQCTAANCNVLLADVVLVRSYDQGHDTFLQDVHCRYTGVG